MVNPKTKKDSVESRVFREYYDSLSVVDKNALVATLMMKCCKSHQTIWRWINGKSTPGVLEAKIISECTGKPVHELFPKLFASG